MYQCSKTHFAILKANSSNAFMSLWIWMVHNLEVADVYVKQNKVLSPMQPCNQRN